MENNLKKCPKCGWEISVVATECPNCGHNFIRGKNSIRSIGKSKLGGYSLIIGIISLLLSLTEWGVVLAVVSICLGVYVLFSKKELYYGTAIVGIVLSMCTLVVFANFVNNSANLSETSVSESYVEETVAPKENKRKSLEKEYIGDCSTYKYKDVLRNPNKFIGKKIKVKVKISSIHKKSLLGNTKYYFAYSNDEDDMWCGNEYVIFDKRSKQKPKLLEDDIIEVYGEIAEPEETVSVIMNSSEVFTIKMKYVKLISE